ncbi:hypothetical protein EDD85DRAFT_772991 [Armillaria nabsnona]|nr:hypothetical protein EDD85DRAFT_772991 [Armillaria nabsnona]
MISTTHFLPLVEALSLHSTGMSPYLAHDLLKDEDMSHLYRHDLETLFYILSMLYRHHQIVESSTAGEHCKQSHRRMMLLPTGTTERYCGNPCLPRKRAVSQIKSHPFLCRRRFPPFALGLTRFGAQSIMGFSPAAYMSPSKIPSVK